MGSRRFSSWHRYASAAAAVVAAALLTTALPILRERFTFFLFWPAVLGVAWFFGPGPAVLATILATIATLLEISPRGTFYVDQSGVAITVALFTVVGLCAASIARWRTNTQAALDESHARFAAVANAAPVLIWTSGPSRGRTYFNKPWLDFTGRPLERELHDGWVEGIHPDDRARCVETYRRAVEAGSPLEMEYRLRRADGQYRIVLDRGVALDASDGNDYVGCCTDITEQREALTAAQAARAAAEAASQAKDAFLATVSHELRAPLSPIITWVQMLRGDHLSQEQKSNALTVIERNARMQAQLIEDLLDVSRIVEGKLRLQVRPVLLADVVTNALDVVRPAADAKEIRLQVVLDTTVAAIPGDPDRLQQVVWNLLSNAVKFTPKGGRVHVVLERVNSHVEIAISDTGAGISKEQLPRLFDRFWQADSTTTRVHAGLGLGLAIVRHLVELHGGAVTAESPGEGQGSTFTVKLPVVPVARRAGEEFRRHPVLRELGQSQPARLDGVRVLLVDDEPDSNEALRVLLDRCGAEVRVAGSAALALEILGRWNPDVLLTDIGMPGEDGYGLLAKVRARTDPNATIPAIALTAYASSEDRVRLLSAGFRLHLAKPAEPGELTAAIASVVNG
jgi:PAS domain S-box-containing protein